jgi:DivIVA domain-containing protein
MDGSPQLLTDVKFKQLKRGGYDPDQVDNFLERVSSAVSQLQDKLRQATDRAESADVHLAEARRLQAEAEAALAQGGGSGGGGAGSDGGDEVNKVLVLAQRVADEAVEEANATATSTVADARAKAVNLLAEAEQERDRMLAKAHSKADAVAEGRVQDLQQQVTELEAARVDLQSDVDALQGHLEHQRVRLHERLAAIAAILDDPDGLQIGDTPPLRNPAIPAFVTEADTNVVATPEPVDVEVDGGGGPDTADQVDQVDQVDQSGGSPEPVDRAPAPDTDPASGSDGTDPGPLAEADEPAAVLSIGAEAGAPVDEHEGDATIDLTTERLFGADSDAIDDGSPATELFLPAETETAPPPKAKAGDSPLGEPDAAADAAMRAFFEQDLEEAPDAAKPRFGRRR